MLVTTRKEGDIRPHMFVDGKSGLLVSVTGARLPHGSEVSRNEQEATKVVVMLGQSLTGRSPVGHAKRGSPVVSDYETRAPSKKTRAL